MICYNYSMKKLLFLFWFFPTLLLASPVKYTWDNSVVLQPYTGNRIKFDQLDPNIKVPVVVFMHGCTGLYPNHPTDHFDWGREITKHGFLVIYPDSFARPDRSANCDSTRPGTSGQFPKAHAYRQEEIAYAVFELRNAPWADRDNIFLMGHSEGGNAVSRSNTDFFKGVIISGWTCTNKKNPKFDGVNIPQNVKIMAVAHSDDPFRRGTPTEGRCSDRVKDRNIIQIDLQGTGHGTYNDKSKSAVVDFLKNNLTK